MRHGCGPALPRGPACAVCAAPLPPAPMRRPAPAGQVPVCHAVGCRMVVERCGTMDAPAFGRYLARQAQARRDVAAFTRRVQEKVAAEARENAVAWQAMEASLAATGPARRLRLVVPSGPRHPVALPRRRREAYRAHVRALIDEAASAEASGPGPGCGAGSPGAAAVAASSGLGARLCGLCAGGCCVRGGDTAYLTVDTIRRVMAAQPGLGADALLAGYVDRLAERTEAGSCINHTARGCALPRELRSDTCNRYACDALEAVAAPADGAAPPSGVLVIRRRLDRWAQADLRRDNRITALALVTEAATTPLRIGAGLPGRRGAAGRTR